MEFKPIIPEDYGLIKPRNEVEQLPCHSAVAALICTRVEQPPQAWFVRPGEAIAVVRDGAPGGKNFYYGRRAAAMRDVLEYGFSDRELDFFLENSVVPVGFEAVVILEKNGVMKVYYQQPLPEGTDPGNIPFPGLTQTDVQFNSKKNQGKIFDSYNSPGIVRWVSVLGGSMKDAVEVAGNFPLQVESQN